MWTIQGIQQVDKGYFKNKTLYLNKQHQWTTFAMDALQIDSQNEARRLLASVKHPPSFHPHIVDSSDFGDIDLNLDLDIEALLNTVEDDYL